jgi:cytochrome P450
MSAVLRQRTPAWRRPIVDAAFLDDPYPTYEAMRATGPVLWSEEFFGGAWLLTRHADVDRALRDPRLSAQRTAGWASGAELRDFQSLFARALLFLDGADHQRVRRVLQAGFRPEALERLRPGVERMVHEHFDRVDPGGAFDFMREVARPLPMRVIHALLGVAPGDEDRFVRWSDDLAAFIGAAQPSPEQARRARSSLLAMAGHFARLLPERRRSPRDDLMSRLLQAQVQGELQAGPEMLAQCAMLLFAGHETTRNVLGNGLHALLTHPEQWERLRRDPSLLGAAIHEILRYDSPVQYTGRRVTVDMELHGVTLHRGDLVVPLIGAANRDPARFAHPDAFDIGRREGRGLSFGAGPHVCIGAALTVLEGEAVFAHAAATFPRLELASIERAGSALYRGFASLKLRR